MSKVLVSETNLTAIADAIRTKKGSEDTYKPGEMAAAINSITTGGGELPEEVFTLKGDCRYMFAYQNWDWFIDNYKDKITTKDILYLSHMFYSNYRKEIPFELNCKVGNSISMDGLFSDSNITQIPKINNCMPSSTDKLFTRCSQLQSLPEDLEDWFDWSYIDNQTHYALGKRSQMFLGCSQLRSIPMGFLNHYNPYVSYDGSIYYYGFTYCSNLDEIKNLPVQYSQTSWNKDAFYNIVQDCHRLKDFTFAKCDEPIDWGYQSLDFSNYTGWGAAYVSSIYPTGKEITDAGTYAELKNDPDSWTLLVEYSRYNKTSALKTIASLPDTSINTRFSNHITFKGEAGKLTDGGAINTMTEEQIAVATAKGWSVSFK